MKLHLPISLRRTLLLTFSTVLTSASSTLYAAVMHADVPLLTYTDFGQNMGRFAAGPTNALLTYIRQQEGGVVISSYTGGQPAFTMPHGMIDFSSQNDGGYGSAIGYNWYATVEHNAVHNNTYVGNFIGGTGNAVHYVGIEYRQSQNNIFRHTPNYDYKITRQSKLLTDVTGAPMYGSVTGDYSGIYEGKLAGQLLYRAGSGKQAYFSYDGVETTIAGGYITGSLSVIDSLGVRNNLNAYTIVTSMNPTSAGVDASHPLPYVGRGGDSGSPAYVWNEESQQYEYIASAQSVGKYFTHTRGAAEWSNEVIDSYNVTINMPTDSAIHIQGIYREGETLSDSTNNVSTTLRYGKLTDDQGRDIVDSEGHVIEYRGIPTGINTWRDLAGIKNEDKWYAYGAGYLNSTSSGQGADMNYADLYNTDNLVFVAHSSQEQHISVDANIDLGIGYVHLRKAESVDSASFTISSAAQDSCADYLLNSAGYVVDEGVSLHLQLTNPADYMREWRKIGEGDMYIEGSGDNNILLNLGGDGTTYLQRENGYSAYNVLANNGTRVVIRDIGQIKRDFTFGFRGGVLDMNGLSMAWNNGNKPEAEGYDPTVSGFTIHALDEHAIISNGTGESTLTWTQGGDQTWLGSFTDTVTGSLKFIYDGGTGSTLTMHSIHTDLTNHTGSGMEVASGTIRFVGKNTLHSMYPWEGAVNGRYFNKDDWHYADSTTNIAIRDGAFFELGSHARLTGDITVQSGGTFIMREGVQEQYEYLEGGYTAEDTYKYRDFYGLKGDIATESGATVRVAYSEGTSSTNVYSGNITGAGNIEVDLGTHGGALILESADSNYSGEKLLTSGTLIASNNNALGSVADEGYGKWKISEKGVLASHGFVDSMASSDIMAYIGTSSSGALALTADRTDQLDKAGQYSNLFVGALSGCDVSYGTLGTDEALKAYSYSEAHGNIIGYWNLGGGGGNLIVNFRLTGDNDLILGNDYGKGEVTLTNIANDFYGSIIFNGAITLHYEDERVLGNSIIKLDYSTRVPGETRFNNLVASAEGVVLVTENSQTRDFDLTTHQNASIASDKDLTFTGSIALSEDAAYHFGGGSGTLTIASDLVTGHDLVIDAQTYSGGTIILNDLADITGKILISGYDETKTALREGDVTLKLIDTQADIFKDNVITMKHGGFLDIAGTTQTFIDLETEEGSLLRSSSEGAAGTVVLTPRESQTMRLAGSMEVADITLSGQGTVELGGTNFYSNLRMENGTVKLISDGALSGQVAWLENTAALNLNAHTVAGNLLLNDGASVDASIANSGVAAGGAIIAAQGTGHIQTAGTLFMVRGDIGAAEGATLELHGSNFTITGENINSSGGTLSFLDSATINFDTSSQTFGGTFRVAGGTTITNAGFASTYAFDTLHIDGSNGKNVIFTTKWVLGWSSTVLTIEHLDGNGLFTWDPQCYLSGESRSGLITFTGEGNFSGVMRFMGSPSGWGPVNRHAEIAHDKALQNATVDLLGRSNSQKVVLAINTGSAQFKGLIGSNANAYVYAGSAGASASFVPTSSRKAAITFTGDGTYEFCGSLGLNDGGTANGLSLVMAGSGTQSFKGETIIVNDVEVQKGTLGLEASNILNVRGNISVTQGASLLSSKALTLNEGKTISVLAGDSAQTSAATINAPSLILEGGALSFSAKTFFDETTASLQGLQSVLAAEGTNSLAIHIIDTSSLGNRSYLLASGDWSALASDFTFTTTGVDYLTATYTASSSGLLLTLTPKDNHFIWNGMDAAHSWTDKLLDERQLATNPGYTVIFNNLAANKDVEIGSPVTAGSIVFDNTAGNNYTLLASAGNSITANDVTKRGNGNTVIDASLTTGTLTVEDGLLQLNQAVAVNAISLQNNGSLEAAGALSGVTNLSMGGNGSLRFISPDKVRLTLNSLTLAGGGSMSIGNANIAMGPEAAALSRYFTANTTLTLNNSVLDDRLASWRITNSTVSLAGNGTLYVERLRLSDRQSSTISTLNIEQGSALIITGTSAGTTSNADGNFALSLWATPISGGNVVNIEGSLTSNAPVTAWDSAATINIREGGTLNLLKGLVRNTGRTHAVTINAGSGSRLNVGNDATGNNLTTANLPVNLLSGSTLGAIGSNVTLSKSFTLGSAGQEGVVTIDTTYSTVAEDGSFAVQQGNEGGVITLSGNISSYNTTSLAIAGKGEVISSNALAIGHDLLVQDTATLTITGAIAVNGYISVANGASLMLNGATFASDLTLASGTLSISGKTHLNGYGFNNSGNISLADNTVFDLALSDFTLNDDGSYTYIFSRGDGAISHSDSVTLSDIFVVNGSSLTDMGEGQYTISRNNGLAITISIKEINWAGRDGHTWETEGAAWNREDNGATATFHNMDTVTFGLDGQLKTVSLSGDKTVNFMKVEAAGYAFEGADRTISVASDLTLTKEAAQTSFRVGLSVNGNLDIAGEATFSQTVTVGGLLTVDGTAIFNNQLRAENPITVTGKMGMTATEDTSLTYRIDAYEGSLHFDTQGNIVNYNSGSLRAGSLRITGGGSFVTNLNNLSLPNMELGAGTTLKITNNGAKDGSTKLFGNISMEDGAILAIHDAQAPTAFTTIDKIILDGGTATVTDTNHSGYNHISALSGTGTLQFHKAAKSTNGSVYELGSATVDPGDFSGNIILRSLVPDNGRRSATLVISNSDIARNAVVILDSTNSANSFAVLGLGIHADTVTLAGLASNKITGSRAIVYSGTLGYNSPLNHDDACTSFAIGDNSTLRTLVLNTEDSTAYTYYGRVLSNLNIVKAGNGTQAFAGASADFNGSLSIEGGALAFNADSKGMLSTASSVTVGSGATLDLSAIAFDETGTHTITLAASATATFAEGSTLNLSHLADGTYQIFQSDATGTFEGWQSLSITMGDSDLSRKMINLETDGVLVLATDKLRWCGTEGSSWATNDQGNWLLQISNNETSFRSADNVIFGDDATASRHVVVDNGGVNPEAMTVIGEGYTFSGGTIQVENSLTIASTGSATFSPGKLSVGSKLAVEGLLKFDIDSDTDLSYNIDASNGGTVVFDTTSALTYNAGSLKADNLQLTGGRLSTSLDVNLNSVTLGENATLILESTQADSGQNKTIGTVNMNDGSVLAFRHDQIPGDYITIGGIALNGGIAKVTDTEGSHSTCIHIETISGSGELQLTKNATSSHCTVYDLGSATSASGDFSGTISVNSNTSGSDRPTALTISNGDIAAHATIHLGTAAANATFLGLGIHADHTTIAGLTSEKTTGDKAILYSGSISGADQRLNASNLPTADAIRTLKINTAANTSHTFNGRVLATLDNGQVTGGLRLEKTGEGTQTFAGSATLVSVDVQNGTLSFTGSATMESVNVQGGTLSFSGRLTVSESITVGDHGNLTIGGDLAFDFPITSAGTVTLQSGANIALNLSDFKNGAYTVISGGNVVADSSTLASMFTIDGSSLADMGASQYSFETANGGLTLTLNGFWAGTAEQYTWSDTQFGPHTKVPGSADTAFFTDEAKNKNVFLASDVHVHHAEFDSTQTYLVTAASGLESLSADRISQNGPGETHIDATVTATDVVVEQGALSLSKKASISGTFTAADNTQLSVAHADIHSLSLGQHVTISSANDDLAIVHADNFSFAPGDSLNIDRVELTIRNGLDHGFTGVTQTLNLTNGAALDDRLSKYRVTNGTLNIDGGGTLYVKGIRLADSSNQSCTLNVRNGSSLIITGSGAGQDGDFSLSHYNASTSINISGTVTSNAVISSWDSRDPNINVKEGGTLNLLKGLSHNGRSFAVDLTVASGARLNASGGTQSGALPVTLQAGSTLGAIGENMTFTNNFTLDGNGIVTIDTNYSTADDNFIVTQGTEGGTVTLAGALTAGAGTTLAIVGNGTASFSGNNSSSFAGALDVQSGATLSVNDSGKSIISAANSVTLGNGATLDLSAIAFDDDGTHTIILAGNATASFSGNNTLNLGHLEDGTYQLLQAGANGSIEGWQSLSITIDGNALSNRKVVNLGTDGALTLHTDKLLWRGSDSSSWAMNDRGNWRLQSNNSATSFQSGDSVIFDDNATASRHVHVDGNATAENVYVTASGYTFSGGTVQVTGDLHISSSGSATFVPGNLAVDGKLAVEGTLTFDMDSNTSLSHNIDASNGGTVIFDTTSAITYNSGSLKAANLQLTAGGSLSTDLNNIELANVELGGGAVLTIKNNANRDGASKTIGNISMGDKSTLAIYDAAAPAAFTTIGKITLDGGTATVTDTNHSGYNHISALSGTGTLQFSKAALSTYGSVYELGSAGVDPGDFSGNIILNTIVDNDGRRSATLVISNGDIAKNAVITLGLTRFGKTSQAMVGLGIHADTATVAGLASEKSTGSRAIVYSGTLGTSTELNNNNGALLICDNSTRRTISINTADDTAYTYYGRFLGNLNIVKTGNGTQTFAGTSADFDGSISVEGGTLAFNASSKGMLSTASSVTVGNGGTLDLSSITFDEHGTNAISLAEGHTITFDAGSTLNLGRVENGTYQIFDIENGGSLVNWESLTRENLTLAGEAAPARAGITFNTNGSITISLQNLGLVWNNDNSADNAVWDYSAESWLNGGSSSSFAYQDDVRFDGSASGNVKVASDILVANVTFDEGSDVALIQQNAHTLTADRLTINGTLSTDFGLSANEVSGNGKLVLLEGARQGLAQNQLGSLSVEVQAGATLTISDANMNGFAWNNATTLEGQGTVEVNLSSNYDNAINVGANFTGTTYVKSGRLSLNESVVGKTLHLGNDVNFQLTGGSDLTVDINLVLDGTSEIHQNSNANLTLNGSLTGTGTYDRRGGGTLTINGETNLSHFLNKTPTNTINIFNGETTLGNLTIENTGVRVTFNKNATITKGISATSHTDTIQFLGNETKVTGNVTLSGNESAIQFNGAKASVTGDIALSGNENAIQFAETTIKANKSANIRHATIEAEKAKSEAARSLLKIQGEANNFAIVDGTIIDLAAATNLELKDVSIGAGTTITGAGADRTTIVFNNATVTLPNTAAAPALLNGIAPLAAAAEGASVGAMWLTQTGTADKACFIPAGTECYAIAAENLAAADIAGSSLTFDVSSYAAQLEGRDLFSIVFEDGITFSDLSSLSITATTGTETYAGFYDSQAEGAPVLYFGKATGNVPEPATTTLGLLALAALAARRRRRG